MVTINANANNSERRRARDRAEMIRVAKGLYLIIMIIMGHAAAAGIVVRMVRSLLGWS